MEATTANHSIDAIPEWGRPMTAEFFENVDFNELNRVAIIRLANAFISKSQKFEDKYQHHPHVQGRPFVVRLMCPPLSKSYVSRIESKSDTTGWGHPPGRLS